MFFKGTARRGVGAIARETKSAGGYLNASTSYDHTAYFTVLPASGLEAALDIQSDALRNSQVDADELARELQVIIQEAKRKLDTPSAVAYETLHEVMFDHHRIRRWRIGHEDQLARLTRDDLWGYYHSRYVPSRTIVSIVGDVTAERAVALAHRMYGEWPSADGRGGPGTRGAEAPRSPRPHPPRRRESGRAGAGMARRPAAPSRLGRARPRRGGARVRAGELALPFAARAGSRHLGGRAQLRPHRARRLQRQRRAAPRAARRGAGRDRRGTHPPLAGRAHRRRAGARAHAGARPVGPPAGVDGGARERAGGGRGAGRRRLPRPGIRHARRGEPA